MAALTAINIYSHRKVLMSVVQYDCEKRLFRKASSSSLNYLQHYTHHNLHNNSANSLNITRLYNTVNIWR